MTMQNTLIRSIQGPFLEFTFCAVWRKFSWAHTSVQSREQGKESSTHFIPAHREDTKDIFPLKCLISSYSHYHSSDIYLKWRMRNQRSGEWDRMLPFMPTLPLPLWYIWDSWNWRPFSSPSLLLPSFSPLPLYTPLFPSSQHRF